MKKVINNFNITQNCLLIIEGLNDDYIEFLKKNIKKQQSQGIIYYEFFDELLKLKEKGISSIDLTEDTSIRNRLKTSTKDYNSLTRNFYNKLIKLLTSKYTFVSNETVEKKITEILSETESLFELGFTELAEIHFCKLYKISHELFNIPDGKLNYLKSKLLFFNSFFRHYGSHKDKHNFAIFDELRLFTRIERIGENFFNDSLKSNLTKEINLESHARYFFIEAMKNFFSHKNQLKNYLELNKKQIVEFDENIAYRAPYIEDYPRFKGKPNEIRLIYKSLLIIEKFYISLKLGDYNECNNSIVQIEGTYREGLKTYTNVVMYGVITFLINEIFKMQLLLFNKMNLDDNNIIAFKNQAEITPKWLYDSDPEYFTIQIEINKIINQFLISVNAEEFLKCSVGLEKLNSIKQSSRYENDLRLLNIMISINCDIDIPKLESIYRSYENYIKKSGLANNSFESVFLSVCKKLPIRTNRDLKLKNFLSNLSSLSDQTKPIHQTALIWLNRWRLYYYG